MQTYFNRILAIDYANIIQYIPSIELSGSDAIDYSKLRLKGTYNGATLKSTISPDGQAAPEYDGTGSDYIQLDYTNLDGSFSRGATSVMAWLRVFNAGVLTDSTARKAVNLKFDASDNSQVKFSRTTTDNQWQIRFRTNATSTNFNTTISDTNWHCFILRWTGTDAYGYVDGSQIGTASKDAIDSGALQDDCVVGTETNGGADPWYGFVSHFTWWDSDIGLGGVNSLSRIG